MTEDSINNCTYNIVTEKLIHVWCLK